MVDKVADKAEVARRIDQSVMVEAVTLIASERNQLAVVALRPKPMKIFSPEVAETFLNPSILRRPMGASRNFTLVCVAVIVRSIIEL
jgi:hypothetical protein